MRKNFKHAMKDHKQNCSHKMRRNASLGEGTINKIHDK